MRLVPRSLAGRLLAVSALSTLVALAIAAFAIGHVLERFVMHGLDDRLDAQVMVLAQALRDDGSLDSARVVDLPGFGEAGSDWSWSVDRPGHGRATSGEGVPPPPPPLPEPPRARPHGPGQHDDAPMPPPPGDRAPHPGDVRTLGGEQLHLRTLTVPTKTGGPVTITAMGPRRTVEAPLRAAMVPLLGSLALLGAALALATVLQLRFGLRPLRQVRTALVEVRSGRRRHVPDDQPDELVPLVTELNALIDQNEAGLAHARRHVANLAHGLKTPLAALALKLAAHDPDGSLGEAVAEIDRRVRHHLRRARAAAPGGTRARTPVAPAIEDLAAVLARVHAERGIGFAAESPPDIAVAVDPQDLDEMIGNLLDNGWRHARSAVRATVRQEDAVVAIGIADDGPGLSDAMIADARVPGRRLDERGDGHGFGLSITEELAELNGGTLTLGRADAGGLLAELRLPLAA